MFTEPQRNMLDRAVATVRDDARLDALLAGGSYVTGGFDAQSDFDFIVVVRTDAHAEVMAERRAIAARLGTLLAAFTGEHVGEPRLLICLYGPPLLHVDLKFVAADDLDDMAERPAILWARDPEAMARQVADARLKLSSREAQWFEGRAWLWLHYSATKLLHGEYFEALGAIEFFRDVVLARMLQRNAGRPQRGARRIEAVTGARERLLPTLSTYDRAAIAAALKQIAALYVELRQGDPPAAPVVGMPKLLLDFLDGVE